jgi:hypothetical protein
MKNFFYAIFVAAVIYSSMNLFEGAMSFADNMEDKRSDRYAMIAD